MSDITLTIDDKVCRAEPGQTIVEAAKANGVYIPTLCNYEGLPPVGSCRVCTVRISGRYVSACTQIVADGMVIENTAPDLEDMRRSIIEMLFVEGNHMCPTCEKSGNCELQALAYRYEILAPRFPYQFPKREIEPAAPKILMEHNRCIQCQRCVRAVRTEDGKKIFALFGRAGRRKIGVDPKLAAGLTEDVARKAMDICPVGSILKKEVGFAVPIGKRKFDKRPIGGDVEQGAGRSHHE
jgi:[NiFe] hydrogenase diaphorase moiety small subunit